MSTAERLKFSREWFNVDRKGLAKILAERGIEFVIWELIQNAWDQRVSLVTVRLEPIPGKSLCRLIVIDDDPDGFADLAHAYTLFAESIKKGDPTKRGKLNLGEKLVLAMCERASIATTTGTVFFGPDGRTKSKKRTDGGSVFDAEIRMTRKQYQEVCQHVTRLIAPVPTMFNGKYLPQHDKLGSFETVLQTVAATDDGELYRTRRKTTVEVYEPINEGDSGWLYEMGIPVQPLGDDNWDLNVQQKVPINLDRTSVPASYIKQLRVEVLNEKAHLLEKDDATKNWVGEATSDPRCADHAIKRTMKLRFGERRIINDPSDREATLKGLDKGYEIVYGGSLTQGQWDNVKRCDAIKPAGQVFPTPKPYSDDPNASPVDIVPYEKWTPDMIWVEQFAKQLHGKLFDGESLAVTIVNTSNNFAACYAKGRLDMNKRRLGSHFFGGPIEGIVSLLLHEFAHHEESNHYSERFHQAIERLAGKTVAWAIEVPHRFKRGI